MNKRALERLSDDELRKKISELEEIKSDNCFRFDNSEKNIKDYIQCLKKLIDHIKKMRIFFSNNARYNEIKIEKFFSSENRAELFMGSGQQEYFSLFRELLEIFKKLQILKYDFTHIHGFDLSHEINELNVVPEMVGRFGTKGKGFINALPLIPNPTEQTHLGTGEDLFGPNAMNFFHELLIILILELEGNNIRDNYKKKDYFYFTRFKDSVSKGYYDIDLKLDTKYKNDYIKAHEDFLIDHEKKIRNIELILRSRKKRKKKEENIGYVYILSNKSLPKNTFKIGSTYSLPEERAEELTGTGHLYPFKVEMDQKFKNAEYFEKLIHKFYAKFRVKHNREFFNLDLKDIKQTIKEIASLSENGDKRLTIQEIKKKL